MTFDLINIWRNPYCIFDSGLVVIRLQLFKGDLHNENSNKLEHTYIYTPHTHYTQTHLLSHNPPTVFKPGDNKKEVHSPFKVLVTFDNSLNLGPRLCHRICKNIYNILLTVFKYSEHFMGHLGFWSQNFKHYIFQQKNNYLLHTSLETSNTKILTWF